MEIKAVKLYENGFMTQPFAMGLEDGEDKFDKSVKYRSTLQNFLIDTGSEVILVDTGMPLEQPDMAADVNAPIYLGSRIDDYVTALEKLGYKKEQVTKILVTHKHPDHTGELRSFPKAKIYISRIEADAMDLQGDNVVRVDFTDGAYANFDKCQKIADGIYYIFAPGHTTGNSIIIVENEGLHYIIHGDVTYTDEALYQNKLSVATEDKVAARDTLNKVRAFIENHRTVYLSTHTPLGYENLENKKVVDLNKMPTPIPPKMDYGEQKSTGKYVCSICGTVYDPAVGDPEHGIPAGTAFEDLPADWKCPVCKQGKDKFNKAERSSVMGIFPDIIKHVPERNYGIEGLEVRVDHTSTGTVYFVSAEKEVPFPEHSHAAQWTVVVSGKCYYTANGKTKTYQQGDTYFIPAGQKHQITLCAGYSEVDYVDDPRDGEPA